MATSIFMLAEKARDILGKGDIQAIISACVDSYAVVVKQSWYENKQDGINEVDGVFQYTFKNIVPEVDLDTDFYYIVIPSSYVRLPHEAGINAVSFMKQQDKPFVRINSGSVGIWANLKANIMGGAQTYYVEGIRMYFPKMTSVSNGNILLKLAIALDAVDVEEVLNIPPDMASAIVDMVVAKYQPKPEVKPDTLQ